MTTTPEPRPAFGAVLADQMAIATFLMVALLSLLFTRLATGSLIATGMPSEAAAFQARSAFTGAGFPPPERPPVADASPVLKSPRPRVPHSVTAASGTCCTATACALSSQAWQTTRTRASLGHRAATRCTGWG